MAAAALNRLRLGEEPQAAIGIAVEREERVGVDCRAQPPDPPLRRQESLEEADDDRIGRGHGIQNESAGGCGQRVVGHGVGEHRRPRSGSEDLVDESLPLGETGGRPRGRVAQSLFLSRGEVCIAGTLPL